MSSAYLVDNEISVDDFPLPLLKRVRAALECAYQHCIKGETNEAEVFLSAAMIVLDRRIDCNEGAICDEIMYIDFLLVKKAGY